MGTQLESWYVRKEYLYRSLQMSSDYNGILSHMKTWPRDTQTMHSDNQVNQQPSVLVTPSIAQWVSEQRARQSRMEVVLGSAAP